MTQSNKIAFITGGSRGLGKDMALGIAQKGVDVILTYNSQKDKALEVVAAIEKIGQKAAALQLNMGDIKSFDGFITNFKNLLSGTFNADKFDFLINNAGAGFLIPSFAETTEEQFDALFNMHFKGVFFLTQQLLPFLRDNGSIVNISSGLTRIGYPGMAAYASAKGAIEILTKYLAKELGPRGITANVIAPGAIPTDFGGGTLRNTPQIQEYMKSITAIPRLGLPEDIGGVVAFLCTPEARWVTGQRIEVSGGMYL
jgi:NAD(P)-dependent dehydrogenase (short-subunit alcohol dehydrogenase family)